MQQYTRFLRLFGASAAELTPLLKAAAAQGCPGLRLLQKDGECVICISAPGQDNRAVLLTDRWADQIREKLGPEFYGEGPTSLAAATADALAGKGKLMVACEEDTGRGLSELLGSAKSASSVYDFGKYSWADRHKAAKIKARRGRQGLAAAADRARAALKMTGADYALALVLEEQAPAALLFTPTEGYLYPLAGARRPQAQGLNALLDMARRLALGKTQASGVRHFVLKGDLPEIPQAESEEEAAPQAAQAAESQSAGEKPESSVGPAPREEEAEEPVAFQAAWELYSRELNGENEPKAPPAAYSLKKKNYRGRILACAAAVLLVAGLTGIWSWYGRSFGNVPVYRGYGTAGFDASAQEYLTKAQEKDSSVQAYLAFSGQPGTLVHDPAGENGPSGAVFAEEGTPTPAQLPEGDKACFAGQTQPGQAHSNLLIQCPTRAVANLGRLDEKDVLRANYGFTLYTDEESWRYKVVSVFYWDPEEEGEGAFDLMEYQDLVNYRDYLDFVVGIKSRSLYELPVDIEDSDSFATLITDSAATGQKLVITGRLVRQSESASVNLAEINAANEPLLPQSTAVQLGTENPNVTDSNQYWLNWYRTGNETTAQVQEEQGMPEEDMTLEELQQALEQAQQMNDALDDALASLTPQATATPGSGTGTPGTAASGTPTPTPKPGTTVTPTPGGGATQTPAPTAAPTPTPENPSGGSGQTINVTMNGVRQTMDLVECLAMVVQNEMGSGQPVEAYKAQAVAAHSWILNMGGYPSVAGITPTSTVRNAVAEVANEILTYNGSVAFTPYFASCNNATCSSEDVWGGVRPYLQAVESPYDSQVATNWETVASYNQDVVADRVKERVGVDLRAYSDDPADWFEILSVNSSGYVMKIRVGDQTYSGKYLRESILNSLQEERRGYAFTIRSAAFDLEYTGSSFVFTARGYGHGCGISQFGAIGYASIEGRSYDWILAHYYPGTSLTTCG